MLADLIEVGSQVITQVAGSGKIRNSPVNAQTLPKNSPLNSGKLMPALGSRLRAYRVRLLLQWQNIVKEIF
jgi:hypothetical protein